jgi:predicted O-methyltransferase YrrM
MSDWNAGYISDLEYTTAFYREQAPSHLNLVALINGCEPPSLERPFTYCELGAGQGFTSNILAASNPRGRFFAVDFNPSHVTSARRLAERAGLDNIEFIEESFGDLAEGARDLPPFDYITLHGVYSWINPENRHAIVRIIRRYLKSGGMVYVSYNAMPGWAGALPLQRLLFEHASLMAERSDRRMERAIAFAQELRNSELRYQLGHSFLDEIAALLGRRETRYLVHEYLNANWVPLFFTDVARELGEAKLEFLGSANLVENFSDLTLTPKQIQLLDTVGAADVREMVKDFCLNRRFRKDVYVRGARRLSGLGRQDALLETRIALQVPRSDAQLELEVPRGKAALDGGVYHPILDALAERPRSIAELLSMPRAGGKEASAMEILGVLAGTAQVGPVIDEAPDPAAAVRINRAVAERATVEEIPRGVALAAPLVGSGIGVGTVPLLAYGAFATDRNADNHVVVDRLWAILAKRGESLVKDGKAVQGEEENRRILYEHVQTAREKLLPLWRSLGVL